MSMVDSPRADRIGVIGGGRMGAAIAQIFAAENFHVTLVEPSATIREAIPARIAEICRARVSAASAVARVEPCERIDGALSDCAFIIEAAPEKLELKQDIFEALGGVCGARTILATNTSVIPVGDIGARTRWPERVVGTHFWNPPYAVRLVEVVQAARTNLATVDATMAQGGVCDAETVDFVIRNSFGARLGVMGTLEQSDLVGLNLTLDIHKVILRDLDRSMEPQKLLVDLVAAGKTGAAVGEGFRTWSEEERAELRSRLDNALLPKRAVD